MIRQIMVVLLTALSAWCSAGVLVQGSDPESPKAITNSIGMKLVLIPPGEFMMGSPKELIEEQQKVHADDKWYLSFIRAEEPQHRVRITKPFYLGVYEVTQGEYEQLMGKNPSKFQDATRPVERVSWEDAVAFCRKLSAKEGQEYRLPTEAEWEYACRAGTTTPFSFGGVLNGEQANCDGNYPYGTNAKGPYKEQTVPIGSYRPNAFGLYDMHGNVWEWCQDRWDAEYYGKSPSENPPGAASGSGRVIRGGCYVRNARYCRAAYRHGLEPSHWSSIMGFRLARTVSSSSPSR